MREVLKNIYEMTLSKIAEAKESAAGGANRVVLFHGSKEGLEGRIEPKSRKQCDFGRGFYMGTDPGQALTLICDYPKSRFYIVSVSTDGLNVLHVPANIDWAMFVACHRGRMEKVSHTVYYRQYRTMADGKDLIIGSIANDRMFYVIDNFFIGNITDTALVNSLSALQLGSQYVAVSQKGCDAVQIETEIHLSDLERRFMRQEAEENRARGISLANEICRKYRREGRFFDELLDAAEDGGLSWTNCN